MSSDLALHLRSHRAARGLSLRQAGAEIGVSSSTLSRVENGRDPDLQDYFRIIKWIGNPMPSERGSAMTKDIRIRKAWTGGYIVVTDNGEEVYRTLDAVVERLCVVFGDVVTTHRPKAPE